MGVVYIRKQWLLFVWLLIGMMLWFIYATRSSFDDYVETFSMPANGKVVVIDPGHGGVDPGKVTSSGTREDKINLRIGLKLRRYLEHTGVKVIMTRNTDMGLSDKKSTDMRLRAGIIENSNADAVISIHLNSFVQSRYYGAQTFYMKGSGEGKRLAQSIQSQLIRVLDPNNTRVIKPADNLFILKAGSAPSVIVECGFLSNPQEEILLKTDEYQDRIAWAIYCGIIEFFNHPQNITSD